MVRHRTWLLKCNRGEGEREDQPSCNDTAESGFKSGGASASWRTLQMLLKLS